MNDKYGWHVALTSSTKPLVGQRQLGDGQCPRTKHLRRKNGAEVAEYGVHAKQRGVDIAVIWLEAYVCLSTGRLRD
jgi:hypothetical protein